MRAISTTFFTDSIQILSRRLSLPVPIERRPCTDFVWQRSPFLLFGGGTGRIEGAGIDYLLPYWMARYHGVLGPIE